MTAESQSGASHTPFWTTDEDGERVHRLQNEWDGNKGGRTLWSYYRAEHTQAEVTLETTWSRWGLGVEASYHHSSTWPRKWDGRVDYREQYAHLSFGPWSLCWRRCKPTTNAPGESR